MNSLKKYLLIVLILLSFGEVVAQDNSIILAKAFTSGSAESSYIVVNKKASWQFLTSYLTPIKSDSVMIEMIVQHDKTAEWNQEQLVEHIRLASMLPKRSRTVSFNLIENVYQLRIEPNGKCYLRLDTGSLLDTDPVIIPVRATYKR
jgi:hypothetical protein